MRDASDGTHKTASFQDAQERLKSDVRKVEAAWKGAKTLTYPVPVRRAAAFEGEVAATFLTLVAAGHLPGYEIRGVPGNSTRYDVLFAFMSSSADSPKSGGVPLGIHAKHFVNGKFERSSKWAEFKVDLADLLSDFEVEDGDPQKKYFEQVDLAIVWKVSSASDAPFDVIPVDKKNWLNRNYLGTTHFVQRGESAHVVEVIALAEVLDRLFPGA